LEVVKYLVSKGADMEARDYGCDTPLSRACIRKKMDVAKFLVSRGANTKVLYMNSEFRTWLQKVRLMEALRTAGVKREGAPGSPVALLTNPDLLKHLTTFLYK
jgi:ankyrin repeat protein